MKILAIHAHPDDIEFLCAGTLALLSQKGHEIYIATLSPGDKGTPDKDQDEISTIRMEEAKNSASIIKAQYHCLGLKDFEIFDDDASRRLVTEYIRSVRPEIVITASPQDYMADHETASTLVRNACFVAPIRNYRTGSAPLLDKIPALYYVDPIEGIDTSGKRIQPDFRIDITSVITTKEKMLACHKSQLEWLLKHHGVDSYTASMKEWSARRGEECNCKYAEGFRQHKGHAYPKENLLGNLLNEYVRYV